MYFSKVEWLQDKFNESQELFSKNIAENIRSAPNLDITFLTMSPGFREIRNHFTQSNKVMVTSTLESMDQPFVM